MDLAGGSWIFLGFLVVMFLGVVWGYYSRSGSDIGMRPFRDRGDTDPTAMRDVSQDVRNWSRGTQGRHKRNVPTPRTPAELGAALDPQVRERLRAWRDSLSQALPAGLAVQIGRASCRERV